MATTADVTLIFAEDVIGWDVYLSEQLEVLGATVQHEQVERMTFPICCSKSVVFTAAKVVLVILSPAMVKFLDKHVAQCSEFTRLLKPAKTIAMICGVSSSSLDAVKSILMTYDEWRCVEAKDKDVNMVRNVVEMMHEMLSASREYDKTGKVKYKLIPRKVQEGNNKVYVMLTKPLDSPSNVKVVLEGKIVKEVPVKKRNPYTLVFVVPDEIIQKNSMLNAQIWCDEDLMGVSPIKCASKMGELYTLLSSANSPYEFLRNALGLGSLYEVDAHLAKVFRKKMPADFSFLQLENKSQTHSDEEFPSLLHFAARYGLHQLTAELLKCKFSSVVVNQKNCKGQTPVQLANHEGHSKVIRAIEDFINTVNAENQHIDNEGYEKPISYNEAIADGCNRTSDPMEYYDIPSQPTPVVHLPPNKKNKVPLNELEAEYIKMNAAQKENNDPCKIHFLEEHMQSMMTDPPDIADKSKLDFLESQSKLIEVMEAYKKGASLTEVEKMHNEWKSLHQVSDAEAKSSLDGLRNLYAKAQKAKLSKKHSSSFQELRQYLNSKLRRKDSVDSKMGSLSRRGSKDSSAAEKSHEADFARPVSTLSMLSNTSSSSGSSFDRLSLASGGSDSGHQSDISDERTNKLKARNEMANKNVALLNNNKFVPLPKLLNKPPAPPPRPLTSPKSEVPEYAVSKKHKNPNPEEKLNPSDFSVPRSKSCTLGNNFKFERKSSISSSDFNMFEDPNANYDCLPPRPSVSPPLDPKLNYDVIPTPIPVPPNDVDESYDIPPRTHCPANVTNQCYDVPPPFNESKLPNITQPQVVPFYRHANNIQLYDNVPSFFHSNNSSKCVQSFEIAPSKICSTQHSFNSDTMKNQFLNAVPSFLHSMQHTNNQAICTCKSVQKIKSCCMGNKLSSLSEISGIPSIDWDDQPIRNQYFCTGGEIQLGSISEKQSSKRDSIPEEMAPPVPPEETDEHYKLLGPPIPIASTLNSAKIQSL